MKNFTGKDAKLTISKRDCLFLLSEVWRKKNYDRWFSVSRGRLFLSSIRYSIDFGGRISCSAESIEAVPRAALRFYSIIKPLESFNSIVIRVRDVKCQGRATVENAALGTDGHVLGGGGGDQGCALGIQTLTLIGSCL